MNLTSEGFRKLLIGQMIIALIAVAVTVTAAVSVAPIYRQREQLKAEVISLRKEVASNSVLLQDSSNLLKSAHRIDFMTAKHLYGTSPCAAYVLSQIVESQNNNVKWKLNGSSPEEGFDSPRFAAWLLERSRALSSEQFTSVSTQDLLGAQQRLLAIFPPNPSIGIPSDGDLVYYKTGYTMFYFNDFQETFLERHAGPPGFVAGMTPFGIAGLDLNFAGRIGVGHIHYPAGGCQ